MNNEATTRISQALLPIIKPQFLQSNKKHIELYFQQSEKYADSFIRAYRKGSGLLGMSAPAPDALIERIELNITCRPNVLSNEWVGYSIDIQNPEAQPAVSLFRRWPQSGGEFDASPTEFEPLVIHILALCSTPLTPDGSEPPREAPEGMF